MAKDKENEMLEKLRQRIRRAAANKKPGKQNTPSMLEEMGGRAKIGRPKIKDALKGSANQSKPSMMSGKMTVAEMEAKLKKKAAENKELAATRARARKAAANKKPTTQVKPSIMKEIESKTGKATGQRVSSSAAKKKEPAKKTTTANKAPAKKESSKKINYNLGESKGGVSFNKAFAHFRKKGAKTFTWNGKKYTTELAKKGKK